MTANGMERLMAIEDWQDNLQILHATPEHEGYQFLPDRIAREGFISRYYLESPYAAGIFYGDSSSKEHEVGFAADIRKKDAEKRPDHPIRSTTIEGSDRAAACMGRIMVIEDMPDNLLVLQATLEHEGYEVLPMMDGESALERLKDAQCEVDLILSDVMMPGLSGYDLCRCLRHDPALAHLPIVLITAKRLDERDALLGINAGADDYLIRPIDPQLLAKKLRLLLDRKQDIKHWQSKYQDKKKQIESTEWGARMLVHDIRNPLGGAIGAIDMLGMDPNITEDQRFLVNLAQNCLKTQMNMLQDMLATVAAKNGSLVLSKDTFDFGACVQEQVSFQQGVMAMERCDFRCQGLEDSFFVSADKKLIGRVVANLIVNALKYGQKRYGVDIWIGPPEKCSLPITGQGRLAFMIINHGPAIPENIQQTIFQPFVMGSSVKHDQETSILTAGVGLGLCFCQKVIELHGGFLNIISPLPGREDGVAFYFVLP